MHPQIADAVVLSRPHKIFDEAIIAFIQPAPPLQADQMGPEIWEKAVEDLAGYKKPLVYIPVARLPAQRVTKTDLHELITLADEKLEELRATGQYDAVQVEK